MQSEIDRHIVFTRLETDEEFRERIGMYVPSYYNGKGLDDYMLMYNVQRRLVEVSTDKNLSPAPARFYPRATR